ncbi:MAG: hypothetical protein HYU86_05375 [Chloroflexi bacterium]|nr:hypothetical protein [Chloroflexota bacterium]
MIKKGELPLQNSGANTAGWIGQIKGRIIYSYDLAVLTGGKSEAESFTRKNFQQDLQKPPT